MKQSYEKAMAKVVLFDNSDVITTSGGTDENGDCWTHGHEQGYGCPTSRSGVDEKPNHSGGNGNNGNKDKQNW